MCRLSGVLISCPQKSATTGRTGAHGGFRRASQNLLKAVLALVALCAGVLWAESPIEQLPAGPMQQKATAACASCHEARIIVQQRLSKAAWTKEVDKMIKWGAEVDAKDRDALIDYLSVNFGPEQAPYVAPKSAANHKSKQSNQNR
jgi:hypothetical protein